MKEDGKCDEDTCHLENVTVLLSQRLRACSSGQPMVEQLCYQPGFPSPLQGPVRPQQVPYTIVASIHQLL